MLSVIATISVAAVAFVRLISPLGPCLRTNADQVRNRQLLTSFVLSEVSGWLIAVLAVITVSLPYLLRGRRLAPQGCGFGYLQRLTPHYWIGYTIAGLSSPHAEFAMSGAISAAAGYQIGVWIATAEVRCTSHSTEL